MPDPDGSAALELVDRVLDDLRLPEGMFVGRRPDPGDRGAVVIQTREEGRHRLALPDARDPRAIENFMAAAQAHLGQVFGRPVPRCPRHDHALVGQADGDDIAWVCPDGSWRCPVGDYDELTWPPDTRARAGDVAQRLARRLGRRDIRGWQRLGAALRDGSWVATVGVWPMNETLIAQLERAAAPIAVEVFLEKRASPEAQQHGLEENLAQELDCARWAVERWAEFPVNQAPRPLVLIGPSARIDDGFRSGLPSSRSCTAGSRPACRFPRRSSPRSGGTAWELARARRSLH